MTLRLHRIVLTVILTIAIVCDALVVIYSSWVAALVGQLPLIALLLWMSHHVERARHQLGVVVATANAAHREAEKPPLTQDDYAVLLRGDNERRRHFVPSRDTRGFYCLRCSRVAESVSIRHPIWDGPFDGAGSGLVDERAFSWCLRCDGPPPAAAGRPLRLPYLDTEPIALLPELFGRGAFHRLAQRVIPAPTLPPIPTHAFVAAGEGSAFCDVCGYAKDDPRHG